MDQANAVEEWRTTPYPGYLVNAHGQVRGRRGTVLRQRLRGKGYPSVHVTGDKTEYVHFLVCTAFHGPRPTPTHQVAHWDGDPTNNRPENLRWATRSENQQDSIRHGTKFSHAPSFSHAPGVMAGEGNYNAKLTWEQVEEMRTRWDQGGISQRALAQEYGIGKSQAHNILARKQWATKEEWAL